MSNKSKITLLVLAVLCLSCSVFAIEEREGFSKLIEVTEHVEDIHFLTVPEGKKFVLLQIGSNSDDLEITADSTVVINSNAILIERTSSHAGIMSHNYPDRCVVFESGQVLAIKDIWPGALIQIVGYFYNCNCPSPPLSDLNKDCKVNFSDLAIMASEWLLDNTA